jgi:acyl-coenzyme A synthetase/AMP-(fatty) acid ligase
MRAGHIPFPISPRNSAPILAHLMSKTSSKILLLSHDTGMRTLAKEANLPEDVKIIDFPTFECLFPPFSSEQKLEKLLLPPLVDITMSDTALILHSSGSTAFPKPIIISHEWVFQQGLLPWFGELDLCGHISALHSIPMFHFSGAVQPWWAALSGLTLAVLPPSPTPIVPSPEVAFQGVVRTHSTIIYGVSVHIEQWACDPKKVAHLATLQAVIFQGAPLTRHAGNTLVKAGVPLVPVYGATEVGGLTIIFPDRRKHQHHERKENVCAPPASDKDNTAITKHEEEEEEGAFEWFRLSPRVCAEFVPHSTDEIVDGRACDIFELVVVQTPSHRLNVTNTVLPDGRAAYATSDLLVRHPGRGQREGEGSWWRVFGRKDDQITLGTGEKVNPVPLGKFFQKKRIWLFKN